MSEQSTVQRTVIIERVRADPPITPNQMRVIALLESGLSPQQAAEKLGLALTTISWYVRMAAKQIPGDMPAAARIIAWYRGAPLYVLEGLKATQARRLRESLREHDEKG